MTTVTIPAGASPGARLLAYEEELRVAHPQLGELHARSLVRDAHPDLVDLHHRGLQEEPPPTVDPGEILNARAHALVTARQARDRADGIRLAMKERPDLAEAWQAGQRMPASTAPPPPTAPVRQHSDPRLVLRQCQNEPIVGGPWQRAERLYSE